MTYLQKLATMLAIPERHSEDALHSESAARAVLTRRNLFAAGGAMAAGSVFSFAVPGPAGFWVQNTWPDITITLPSGEVLRFPIGSALSYEGPAGRLGERIQLEVFS
jgi:hypothetical protein